MMTIFKFLSAYCQERNLPQPSHRDLTDLGKIINTHWRKNFVNIDGIDAGVRINGAGFTIQKEGDQKIVVIFYPDTPQFLEAMKQRADAYYEAKAKKAATPQPRQQKSRKRNRIKPEFSAKPSNINSRTY